LSQSSGIKRQNYSTPETIFQTLNPAGFTDRNKKGQMKKYILVIKIKLKLFAGDHCFFSQLNLLLINKSPFYPNIDSFFQSDY